MSSATIGRRDVLFVAVDIRLAAVRSAAGKYVLATLLRGKLGSTLVRTV